ncbi:MAG: Na+/H+ antiporter subunit B [Armatimonadota bacterium]|nr:Na+/H+ antiporter subunit B [Armatimonadota bacterium]
MPSLILSTASRYLLPLLLLFSVFVLLRGHNESGGGFVGGLMAAAAFALHAIAEGPERARHTLRRDPRALVGVGLLVALMSGLAALVADRPFLTGVWVTIPWPEALKVGTPLVFDAGVYLVVAGTVLTILFSLMEA